MQMRFRSGGLAAWSIRRPVAVVMLALSVVVLGLFSFDKLSIDLLPHIIYPEVRVRISDPGVPPRIMEDQITRQLEEQLAITEGAISVQSSTSEGRSAVDLSFPYGADIDLALRDASTRLDRAKRFLPTSIEPPIIYKRDPSQIPIMELAVSTTSREARELRDWVDFQFSNWFVNLPGVASTEVGGGDKREIQIIVDQEKLARLGLTFNDVADALDEENRDYPGGRLYIAMREMAARTEGRITDPAQLAELPIGRDRKTRSTIRLRDVARVQDGTEESRLRVRLNQQPAIKLSIQKQPQANTVDVVDAVIKRLAWLKAQKLIPPDIQVDVTADQSIYIRHSLNNATIAVLSGALLAMLVVYLFLGDLNRTLVIGLSIPLAIFVTLIIMALSGLTLNIMTLGGLALGVGLLVDNAIVMLENINRHQQQHNDTSAAIEAAQEVNSAIVASTSTNLAAILPFLFIGGLVGLLFSELIITLSAAILASLLVALTVVPALGSRAVISATEQRDTSPINRAFTALQRLYDRFVEKVLRRPWLPVLVLLPALLAAVAFIASERQSFLPRMDEGSISISISGDNGTQLEEMDKVVKQVENLFLASPEVSTVFTTVGGFIFGRSEFQASNHTGINVQLSSDYLREHSSQQWIRQMSKKIKELNIVGFRVRMRARGIRGFHLGRGDDDISIRVQGDDLDVLKSLGDEIVERLNDVPGLRNLTHSYENLNEEVVLKIDRERAASLGIQPGKIGRSLQVALDGRIVSQFIDKDRQYNIRLRIPRNQADSRSRLENLLVGQKNATPIRLRDIGNLIIDVTPQRIQRDNQRRIVEISASVTDEKALSELLPLIDQRLADMQLPDGYLLYDGGLREQLQQGQSTGYLLLMLAIFLVYVVMAVQYESLRNPLIILLAMPFTIIGVAAGLYVSGASLSIPVWLGLIMLAGIVVNNAIVLVEQIEIEREKGKSILDAIKHAAHLRLRPILMTTLTTVVGMLPLALAFGEGSEMLQPLAIVIVWGLLFSTLVTLLLVPALYAMINRRQVASKPGVQ